MIEFSIGEIVLFTWAAVATAYAFKYKHEAYMTEFVLRKVIEDEKVRNQLVGEWEKFKASEG
jgi:hypothetical protein